MAEWGSVEFLSAPDFDRICARCSASTDEECRCMCASPFPYKKLEDEKDEQPVKMIFYKHEDTDEGKISLFVQRDLTVAEVSALVAVKMNYSSAAYWSIVEYWVDKKAVRLLEDHEIMVDIYYEMIKFKRRSNVRYLLRQDTWKYDLFYDPARIRNEGGVICENRDFFDNYHEICYIEGLIDESVCPVFFSRAGMRVENRDFACFLLLKDQRLFYTADTTGTQKLLQLGEMFLRRYYQGPESIETNDQIHVPDIPGIVLIGKLSELHVYRVNKIRPNHKDHLLLRPAATPDLRNLEQQSDQPVEEDPYVGIPVLPKALIRLTSFSDNFATTWIQLMRLAKYGKQLRENYRAFKNKNETSSREFGRANVPNSDNSPLFQRRGCKKHLGVRATLKRNNHENKVLMDFSDKNNEENKVLMDFSDRIYPSSSRRSAWPTRKLSDTFQGYLYAIKSIPKDNQGGFSRLSRSFRGTLKIGRQVEPTLPIPKPTFRTSRLSWEEPKPSTSRGRGGTEIPMVEFPGGVSQASEPAEPSQSTSKFGAIRKIFSSKKKKSQKKKKPEFKQEFPPVHYREYESGDPFVSSREEGSALTSTIAMQSEAAALLPSVHLPAADIGATSRDFFSVSAIQQSVATASTSDAGNDTQPTILEREDQLKRLKEKEQRAYVADQHEEDFPTFALISAHGEFIKDYYPEHLKKKKE